MTEYYIIIALDVEDRWPKACNSVDGTLQIGNRIYYGRMKMTTVALSDCRCQLVTLN